MSPSLHRLITRTLLFSVLALSAAWVRVGLTNFSADQRLMLCLVLALAATFTFATMCRELIAISAKWLQR